MTAHGDAMDFTAAALAEAALRRTRGGRPGTHTAAAAFGPDIAVTCGEYFEGREGTVSP